MGHQRRRYTVEYKREAVRFLEETGRPLREVAEELKVPEGVLGRWRKQYGTGASDGAVSATEAEELRRLRREKELLRPGRDFLKKTTADFANPSPRGTPASRGREGGVPFRACAGGWRGRAPGSTRGGG